MERCPLAEPLRAALRRSRPAPPPPVLASPRLAPPSPAWPRRALSARPHPRDVRILDSTNLSNQKLGHLIPRPICKSIHPTITISLFDRQIDQETHYHVFANGHPTSGYSIPNKLHSPRPVSANGHRGRKLDSSDNSGFMFVVDSDVNVRTSSCLFIAMSAPSA